MNVPASPHFTTISLRDHFNVDRASLPATLTSAHPFFGLQSLQGIPFELGLPNTRNVLLLDREEVRLPVENIHATYLIFLHVVEDQPTRYLEAFADEARDGRALGQLVSNYRLIYQDESSSTVPILHRFEIQQLHFTWGASAFAAIPAIKTLVFPTASEAQALAHVSPFPYGDSETRVSSGRDLPKGRSKDQLWLFALPNPSPDKPIREIVCTPKSERSLIYAISYTTLADHPLRPGLRRKLRLTLPKNAQLDALGEYRDMEIDLGSVISARAALDYDRDTWLGTAPDAQPKQSTNSVVVEYAAHPAAKLYVSAGNHSPIVYDLQQKHDPALVHILPAHRPVRVRIVEKGSGQPVAARLHLHGASGEYLPPRGNHRQVNPFWFEDNYGELVNGLNQYAYVPGECVVDLPLGQVFANITRGFEVAPVRRSFNIAPETNELVVETERVLPWREKGWVTADTHVHFISPQTALLEGAAEGVNVVNLLASQWGEMFSNVSDFDGKTTLGSLEAGGNGEFLVRVGTENRMQVLGHISLLGYSGAMIHPLCTGGPTESALGDPQEVTMAEWAQQCIDQGGLVVLPHAPDPQCERAADIVLDLVHGIELQTFNPYMPQLGVPEPQISRYGLADWYRHLNVGHHVPIVGGSDKMSATMLMGGIRTYTQLGDLPFTYENWMKAVRAGNTFVSVGPLVQMSVEGQSPGSVVHLPTSGGKLNISWQVESASVPLERVEIIVGGRVVEDTAVNIESRPPYSARGSAEVAIHQSTWIALRVRGSCRGVKGEIAAHSSAVQVRVDDRRPFSPIEAAALLQQIEGAITYVDTVAPRPDAVRFDRLRATLLAGHERLHRRLHAAGDEQHHAIYENKFH